jgi:hypothetical protein
MRMSKLLWIVALCVPAWAVGGPVGSASAQGVNDPSGLGPTMTFPIRPRNEPGGTTATPNLSHVVPQRTPRLQRAYPYRTGRAFHPHR